MSRVAWYWHRLAAMDKAEIAGRIQKRWLQAVDARRGRDWMAVRLNPGARYPQLPSREEIPESLRGALRADQETILAGKWRAFGHLPIQVSDPPEWHKDYLAGVNLPTNESAFRLNHRDLPKGADIKLIWELSRWYSLTRLALGAYACGDTGAARKCVHWLEHWVQHNPPYRGWNWTSALEAGMRLVQFTWIDALLQPFAARGECETELEQLRYEILPAHVWFTWRHKSFGSSANNHLLGELTGLIVATARWPELSAWGATINELQRLWEREVLAQFAEDGGNREQALHYHLFSFELCWHARRALQAAGRGITASVDERLARAAQFFVEVQAADEHWDYGDSDDAFVLPLAMSTEETTREWWDWLHGKKCALSCFVGEAPKRLRADEELPNGWRVFAESGILTHGATRWFLRWDVSPLGYLSTAAHGHLDALHLSIWLGGKAMVIDPGTGAYYGDVRLRQWLASGAAHNGPCSPSDALPRRLGPFLWSGHHAKPRFECDGDRLVAEMGGVRRSIRLSEGGEVVVEDSMQPASDEGFTVLWQFAPQSECRRLEARRFTVMRGEASMEITVSGDWEVVDLVAARPTNMAGYGEGTVSAHFRAVTCAPYLKLTAKGRAKPCVFSTTFLASRVP